MAHSYYYLCWVHTPKWTENNSEGGNILWGHKHSQYWQFMTLKSVFFSICFLHYTILCIQYLLLFNKLPSQTMHVDFFFHSSSRISWSYDSGSLRRLKKLRYQPELAQLHDDLFPIYSGFVDRIQFLVKCWT